MKAYVALVGIVAAVCGVLLWVTFSAMWERHEVEARFAAANAQQADRCVQLARMEREIAEHQKRSQFASAKAASSMHGNEAAKTEQSRPRPPGLLDFSRDNPQILNEFIASQKAELQARYVVLFQKLKLTSEQIDRFKSILAGRTARSMDIGSAVHAQGLAPEDPVARKLWDDSQRQTETEMVELLGETGYQAYREFERTLIVRGFVDGFAVQVSSSEPLTPKQAEQLANVLAGASSSYRQGKEATPADIDWTTVDAQAQTFLSPVQFAVWKLGTAHNPFGGSRLDVELKKRYDAAMLKFGKMPGG